MSRTLDHRSRFQALGQATASPMGKSLSSPPGLSRHERTEKKYPLFSLDSALALYLSAPFMDVWLSRLAGALERETCPPSLSSLQPCFLSHSVAVYRAIGRKQITLLPLQTGRLRHVQNPGVSLLPSVLGWVQHLTAANVKPPAAPF